MSLWNIEVLTHLKSDIIFLTETWLEEFQNLDNYKLPDYNESYIVGGRGKGIAAYSKDKFSHKDNVKANGFSISVFQNDQMDVVGIYRSQDGNMTQLIHSVFFYKNKVYKNI